MAVTIGVGGCNGSEGAGTGSASATVVPGGTAAPGSGSAAPGTTVAPIPEGWSTVTPHLTVRGIGEAIAFYKTAFGAEVRAEMPGPDGKTLHAEITIGESIIMLGEEALDRGEKSPLALGGTPTAFYLYVEDVDAVFAAAAAAGAKEKAPVADMFWGDRFGEVVDPFGHAWGLATRVEDLTDEEMTARGEAFAAAMAKGEPPPKYEKGKPAASKIPDEHRFSLGITVAGASRAIDFYKTAFGAEELMRLATPDGKIMHAEIKIGDSVIMLADSNPERGSKSPKDLGGSAMALHIYVDDVDAAFAKAVDAGATSKMAVADMFWGDRYGALTGPFGHTWALATHKEDLTPEQMAERMKAAMAKGAP